jgi:hypothetical protein
MEERLSWAAATTGRDRSSFCGAVVFDTAVGRVARHSDRVARGVSCSRRPQQTTPPAVFFAILLLLDNKQRRRGGRETAQSSAGQQIGHTTTAPRSAQYLAAARRGHAKDQKVQQQKETIGRHGWVVHTPVARSVRTGRVPP